MKSIKITLKNLFIGTINDAGRATTHGSVFNREQNFFCKSIAALSNNGYKLIPKNCGKYYSMKSKQNPV